MPYFYILKKLIKLSLRIDCDIKLKEFSVRGFCGIQASLNLFMVNVDCLIRKRKNYAKEELSWVFWKARQPF